MSIQQELTDALRVSQGYVPLDAADEAWNTALHFAMGVIAERPTPKPEDAPEMTPTVAALIAIQDEHHWVGTYLNKGMECSCGVEGLSSFKRHLAEMIEESPVMRAKW